MFLRLYIYILGHQNIDRLNHYCEENEYQLEYILQPPNSPDLNILDLCLFNSLSKRSSALKKEAKSKIQLIEAIEKAFDEMDRDTVCVTYGHLFACYNEILLCYGSNQYESPHAGVRNRYYADKNAQLNLVTLSYEQIQILHDYVANWFVNNP